MPNHCYNELTIKANQNTIGKILNKHFPKIKSKDKAVYFNDIDEDDNQNDEFRNFDFNTIVENPYDKDRQDDTFMLEGEHEWKITNWGTKWNAYDQCLFISDTTINCSFYTAWSPPSKIYEKLCELYPNIEMNAIYEESGINFEGEYWNDKGVLNNKHNDNPKRILRGG